MREKVGKSRNTAFFQWFGAPEGRKVGSLKQRVQSQLARWEMKNCARSTFASQNVQNVFSSCFFGRCFFFFFFFFLITRAAPHQDPPTAKGQTPNGSANILIKIEMREYVLQHIHAQFLSFLKIFLNHISSTFFPLFSLLWLLGSFREQRGYKADTKMTTKCKKMQKSAKKCKTGRWTQPLFFVWKFPTCQGNISPVPPSFSASALSSGPQLQALDRSVRRQTGTASTGSECSPPDINCKRWIAVIPAGPPPQAQDQIDPRRTSTTSSGSDCSPLDSNSKLRIRVILCRTSTASTIDRSVRHQTRTASTGSEEWSPPDLNCKR